MRASQVEGVTAVYVMVKGLLDQVLGLVPGELGHPARTQQPESVGRRIGGAGGGGGGKGARNRLEAASALPGV